MSLDKSLLLQYLKLNFLSNYSLRSQVLNQADIVELIHRNSEGPGIHPSYRSFWKRFVHVLFSVKCLGGPSKVGPGLGPSNILFMLRLGHIQRFVKTISNCKLTSVVKCLIIIIIENTLEKQNDKICTPKNPTLYLNFKNNKLVGNFQMTSLIGTKVESCTILHSQNILCSLAFIS